MVSCHIKVPIPIPIYKGHIVQAMYTIPLTSGITNSTYTSAAFAAARL
jgi:hypothetical protein